MLRRQIEFDEAKNLVNIKKHGISFPMARLIQANSVIVAKDPKKYPGETRYILRGLIMGRLHVMIFTMRSDKMRIISLRKANKREVTHYENETA